MPSTQLRIAENRYPQPPRIHLEHYPDNRTAQSYLAAFLTLSGRFDEARDAYPPPRGRTGQRIALLQRNWDALARELTDAPEMFESQFEAEPGSLWRGWLADGKGEVETARLNYEAAVRELEAAVSAVPGDERLHGSLGLALAGLDRADEALEHAGHALELLPRERDAMVGPSMVLGLARIQARLDLAAESAETLEDYWSQPYMSSATTVRLDPRFDRVRDDPAFAAVVDRQAATEETSARDP